MTSSSLRQGGATGRQQYLPNPPIQSDFDESGPQTEEKEESTEFLI